MLEFYVPKPYGNCLNSVQDGGSMLHMKLLKLHITAFISMFGRGWLITANDANSDSFHKSASWLHS